MRSFLISLLVCALALVVAGGNRSVAATPPHAKTLSLLWHVRLGAAPDKVLFDGIAVDSKGDVFVADAAADRMLEVDSRGRQLRTWGSKGRGQGQFDFRITASAVDVGGVAVDGADNIYVSEAGTNRVQKFDSQGRRLLEWGPSGTIDKGGFSQLIGLATDRAGNVYTDDGMSHFTVQRFDSSGHYLAHWPGRVNDSGGIAATPAGQVYVADYGGGKISRLTSTGRFLGSFGRQVLSTPTGVGTAGGNVFVADPGIRRIVEFSPAGKLIAAFTGAPSGIGKLKEPAAVATDRSGHVFVFDQGSFQLLAFKLGG